MRRCYKSACEFDETRVRDDYSVIGSEFCDFPATARAFMLIGAFDKARLLEKKTYGKFMGILRRAKKTRLPNEGRKFVRMNPLTRGTAQETGAFSTN